MKTKIPKTWKTVFNEEKYLKQHGGVVQLVEQLIQLGV